MKKKKILFYYSIFMNGGIERVFVNLLNNLNQDKYQLILLNASNRSTFKLKEGIKNINLDKARARDGVWEAMKVMKLENPDILIAGGCINNITILLAKKLFFLKAKTIFTLHAIDRTNVRKKLIKWFYPMADKVIGINRGSIELTKKISGVKLKEKKIEIIGNPVVDDNLFRLAKEEVNHKWLDGKHKVFTTIGRLSWEKTQDVMIRALNEVRDKSVKLIIIGEGPDEKKHMELVKELGLEKRVDFLGHQVNPFKYISKCDGFLLSSKTEGFGMVLVEAMACGLPVISTKAMPNPEDVIIHEKTGLLCEVGDYKEMARLMERILEDTELREKLVKNSQETVKKYSVENAVKKYEKVFDSLG
jgi:glycosyltransferase involved in cell wall biosynthesis